MNQKTLTWASLAAGIFVTGLAATNTHAQSSDALINKLVDKGILSAQEAKELREEVDKGFSKAYAAKSGMPDWVKSLKFNGDFRGRFDGIFEDSGNYGPAAAPAANAYANHDRYRLRYRLRFGATVVMSDHFEVGLRLGSGEPTSTANLANGTIANFGGSSFSANTTLNNDASRKFIFIDLAYARWTPAPWVQAEIGKMASAFWITDMILDPDYNPEGAQEKFSFNLNDKNKLSFTAGQFAIAENFSASGTVNNNDTFLFVNQLDWAAKWTPRISSRLAVAMYNFKNQGDIPGALETFINQNGTPAVGAGAQPFNPVIARAEVTYQLASFPGFTGEFPISVGGEYANNPAASPDAFAGKTYNGRGNEAYNFGVQFGSSKAKGNWQVAYNYKNIEPASVWHGLNDDDFGFNAKGGTDVRGHQIIAAYHVYNPLTIGVRYMRTEQINNIPGTKAEQDRFFFDLLWAF